MQYSDIHIGCTRLSSEEDPPIGKIGNVHFCYFSINFWIFDFFIAVFDPRRVSIGFPEAVRSILAEQCHKQSHGDPIKPPKYVFFTIFNV